MSKPLLKDINKQLGLMGLNEQSIGGLSDMLKMLNIFNPETKQDTTTKPEEKVETPKVKQPVGQSDFDKIVQDVIDNLEGGYYHPDMTKDGRLKSKGGMGNSGETMFGMDRKHGTGFAQSSAGQEFWGLIDKAGASKNWAYNYRGGNLESKLKPLVTKMIQPVYDSLSKRYLSDEARKIVQSDPKLTFNFAYATWNGPGWFQKFAKKVNKAVEDGITDPKELAKVAIDARLQSGNSLIAQGGRKVSKVMDSQYA